MEDKVQKKTSQEVGEKDKMKKKEKKDKNTREAIKNPTSECSRKRRQRKLWEGNYQRNNTLKFSKLKHANFQIQRAHCIQYNK